ncbi:MAG: tRNA (5-methylaminomethyl-2-thiouridine)(34)-methyltransferase MnmD [Litoreibacter sp.]|nr:tRNA (5-methylaminomethyl-2-thiouridine)(34)-methyltransferase MnmD [Litoreibacter sp.]
MNDQRAEVEWRDGEIPVSIRFDDPYYSLDNGLAETRHVFLAGNDLPERFAPGFHIAELGFGTGLNMLTALRAFRKAGCGGQLHFTSFEAYPMAPEDIAAALAAFPELDAAVLLDPLSFGEFAFETEDLKAEIIIGDARETLARWSGSADAWFLDGFSPAKNPEMWDPALMTQVGAHTVLGGTFATYTAAGFVRRGLEAAGFDVIRSPGFGRKRHMSTGRRP